MKIYDTLQRSVVDFIPRTEGEISLYACGPTVYDHPHLGHARQAITYDVARRYFEWLGLRVHHVANITDIDDKIIARALREDLTETEVAEKWEAVYDDVMAQLGVLSPHDRPHATGWVEQMISFIQLLVDNGTAYANDTGVYLRVRSVEDYGALVHRTHDELAEGAGARVEIDDAKEDPLDFALWKAAKAGEPTWESPWGPGRPGWHIECVAMSLGVLGDGFDIHGGGDDLVFPHHTNERAEALACDREFARYWMHNAMVNIDGEKMSKSLNNFTTVQDLIDEDPLNARALRLLLLQTHYRKTLEINPAVMAQAREGVRRIDSMYRKAEGCAAIDRSASLNEEAVAKFKAAMDNDFGTPDAIATVFDLVRRANGCLDASTPDGPILVNTAIELADALGLRVAEANETPADDEDAAAIDALVEERNEAKANKDWARADEIRDALASRGIVLEDTPNGTIWRRA